MPLTRRIYASIQSHAYTCRYDAYLNGVGSITRGTLYRAPIQAASTAPGVVGVPPSCHLRGQLARKRQTLSTEATAHSRLPCVYVPDVTHVISSPRPARPSLSGSLYCKR